MLRYIAAQPIIMGWLWGVQLGLLIVRTSVAEAFRRQRRLVAQHTTAGPRLKRHGFDTARDTSAPAFIFTTSVRTRRNSAEILWTSQRLSVADLFKASSIKRYLPSTVCQAWKKQKRIMPWCHGSNLSQNVSPSALGFAQPLAHPAGLKVGPFSYGVFFCPFVSHHLSTVYNGSSGKRMWKIDSSWNFVLQCPLRDSLFQLFPNTRASAVIGLQVNVRRFILSAKKMEKDKTLDNPSKVQSWEKS